MDSSKNQVPFRRPLKKFGKRSRCWKDISLSKSQHKRVAHIDLYVA